MQSFIPAFTDGNSFADAYICDKQNIVVTCISKNYTRIAHNWFLHLERLNLANEALICCLDLPSYTYAQANKLPSVFLDQEYVTTHYSAAAFANAYRVKHHLCRVAFLIPYLLFHYNLTVLYADSDMVFLKNPVDKIKTEAKGYDTCIYSNKTYEDILAGRDDYTHGGLPMIWTKSLISKLLKGCEDHPNCILDADVPLSHDMLLKTFNLKTTPLHAFQFTNKTIWDNTSIREIIKSQCYAIHYNIVGDITKFVESDFISAVDKKQKAIAQDGFWLLD